MVRKCISCQAVTPVSCREPLQILRIEKIFTTYGVPEVIKSDNRPPFNSKRFADFAEEQGFKHRKVTPGWTEANGDVERFMRTVKKSAKTCKNGRKKRGGRNAKNG